MKTIHLLSVLFLLVMTSSCSSIGVNPQDDWQTTLAMAQEKVQTLESGQGICKVSADYGQRVYDFTLSSTVTRGTEGLETTLIVLEPDVIAEIQVTQKEGSSRLIWDDLILETGELADISPIAALPFLLSQLEKAYVQSGIWKELETVSGTMKVFQLEIREPEVPMGRGVETTIYLDGDTLALMGGEIYQDGVRVISCGLSDFSWSFSQIEP